MKATVQVYVSMSIQLEVDSNEGETISGLKVAAEGAAKRLLSERLPLTELASVKVTMVSI